MTRATPNPVKMLLLGAAFLVFSAAIARADTPGPNHLTQEAVNKIVLDAGYTNPHDFDFDDDHGGEWELEAFNADGAKVDITVNAVDGTIKKVELDD